MAWSKATGTNPNISAIERYLCDTEDDIKNLPLTIAPAVAVCIGSGNEFYLTEPNGVFRVFGKGTAAKCDGVEAAPAAGAKVLPFDVALSCGTPSALIHYTVDGSAPDATKTLYEEPFEVDAALTVKAIAIAAGYANSDVLSVAYTQAVTATPVADPVAGEVAENTQIALSCATAGAAIYYTVDGSVPDNTKTLYSPESKPTIPAGGVTIKAIAIADGYADSAVLEAVYTIAA